MVRYRLRHWQFAGGLGPELVREVFVRGHAAAVLPYDPVRDEVVLIEQFRAGALETDCDPWLLETVAGIIEDGESADEVARREALEEAGLEILDLVAGLLLLHEPGRLVRDRARLRRPGRRPRAPAASSACRTRARTSRSTCCRSQRRSPGSDEGSLRVAHTVLAMQWLARHREALRARWRQAAPVQAT